MSGEAHSSARHRNLAVFSPLFEAVEVRRSWLGVGTGSVMLVPLLGACPTLMEEKYVLHR